jgi:preprotein translocase subunit SecG
MYNLILFIHIIIVIALMGIILIQRGRSGGLIEALGGVESIFGTKTSSFFVRLTVILAVLFFLTSISLAYLSKERGKSLIEKYIKQVPSKENLDSKEAPLQNDKK